MSTEAFNKHFRNPHNRRELPGAAGSGRAGEADCGAEVTIHLRFDGALISEASFLASGSSAIIAAASLLTQRLEGLDWKQAAAIPAGAIYISLAEGGGDESDMQRLTDTVPVKTAVEPGSLGQACEFAVEALHRAFEDTLRRGTFPAADTVDPETAIVAMSGGVDSSTACLLEQRAGRQVIGVTMRLWDEGQASREVISGNNAEDGETDPGSGSDDGVSCCSPESIRDARQVCHGLGLPHLTVDYTRAFEQQVVADFIMEYLAGRTPNPCTICNGAIRFPALVELAELLGAGMVATGHYVRIVEREGRTLLARGRDAGKDQSYMLWGIGPSLLPWLDFPLGEIEKVHTREIANQAGLRVYNRVDSQDVCFIPGDDYRRFIIERAGHVGGTVPGEGEIVTTGGRIVGYHCGYLNFTVGQRRGLGISSREPLYVVSTDPGSNTVVVGTRDELAVSSLTLEGINAFLPLREIEGERSLMVQVRYNSPAVPCRLYRESAGASAAGDESGAGSCRIELEKPVYGVAPGQSAVLYIDDAVAAGGRIA